MRSILSLVATIGVAALAAPALGVRADSMYTVKIGAWSGVSWRLSATDSSDGSYCISMTVPAHAKKSSAESCGSINAGSAHGVSFMAHTGAPLPNYVVGPVTAAARTVEIRLSDGTLIRTPTIGPSPDLVARIRFYAAQLPCPSRLTYVGARDATGRLVGHLAITSRRYEPKVSC